MPGWREFSAADAAVGKLASERRTSGRADTRVSPSSTGGGDSKASETSCCPLGDVDDEIICHSIATSQYSLAYTSLLFIARRCT